MPELSCQPQAAQAIQAPTDSRIRDLEHLVETGRYDLLSVDVFDTLVWRMVPTPTDLFFLVANRLRALGMIHETSSPESFVLERTRAEERARKKRPTLETTLDEIYDAFPSGYLKGIDGVAVARLEFEIEKEVVRVHPDLAAFLERSRGRGLKLALVSDTYFNSRQIRELVGIDVDHLLLSSERNISKHLGLHRFLLEESGVEPQRILHIGDNYEADIEGPSIFNIERYWFRKFPDAYRDLLELELPQTLSRRAPYFTTHDRGLTTLRSRAMFESSTRYEAWGAGILGPIIAGFSDWVVDRCRQIGIDTALCLMREGRILKRVIDTGGDGLATKELFISRYCARKAAIFEANEREITDFIQRPAPQPRGRILEQLGLTTADLGDGDPEAILEPEESLALIRRITGDHRLRRKVIDESARVRDGLLRHLGSLVDLRRPGRVAVVDLGYSGTIQGCLQRILDHEGIELATHGLYVVTGGEVGLTQAGGVVVEGWLAENGQPIGMAHTFMRSPEIVEQSLMADCGTTLDYADDGEPLLDVFHVPTGQREEILQVQAGLYTYAQLWRRHKRIHGITETQPLKELYRAICIRSVARPVETEIELFGGWKHDENFGSESTRGLATPVGLDEWEQSHLSTHQLASLPSAKLHWPFGFAHKISRNMGEAVASIFERTAPPEAFDAASGPKYMIFYWDSGGGFHADESTLQSYALNNRGKLWQRFTLDLDHGRNIRCGFTIGLVGEILQLTGVTLHYEPKDGVSRILKHPHEIVEMAGYERICGNLYLVKEDPALLVVPTPDVDAFTGRLHVDVFFSMISGV